MSSLSKWSRSPEEAASAESSSCELQSVASHLLHERGARATLEFA